MKLTKEFLEGLTITGSDFGEELVRLAKLGTWVEENETTIVTALERCMKGYSVARITTFERTLDAYNTLRGKK